MIQPGQLAYFGKEHGSYKPIGPAHHYTRCWDRVAMLWGDPVYVIEAGPELAKVSTKGHYLEIKLADLVETPILSIYQIDVGQGDAALVHTPDDRWLMIDGGPAPADSNSGKGAADFLFWKMFVDQSWRREFNLGPRAIFRATVPARARWRFASWDHSRSGSTAGPRCVISTPPEKVP